MGWKLHMKTSNITNLTFLIEAKYGGQADKML